MTPASIKATGSIVMHGGGLAVRIPAGIASAAGLAPGTPVLLEITERGLLLRTKPRLTLAQKLQIFDPAKHGGEAAAAA